MKRSRMTILGLVFLLGASAAIAGGPTEAIRSAIDRGVEILKNADIENPRERAQVIDRLRQIVYPLFDFGEMAKRSLGPHWRRLTPPQQKEFVSAFTALLEKTYAGRIDLYDGQKVVYLDENIDGEYAQVDSRIIDKNGRAYSVVYRLHRVDGAWRIYDVVAENISLVNNYRSQFNRVLAKSSFEELMRLIRDRAT
ncbi:MAG TPA: ABC transporter substrate-binding protein [Candidatus Acidoferrales bacterium]|nr:ABC transporter substrate-binding protein [Candidatus Acidoferrales bacterium]